MPVSTAHSWRQFRGTRNDDAWANVIKSLQGLLAPVVARVSMQWGVQDPSAAQDVLQEVFLKLTRDKRDLITKVPEEPDTMVEAYFRAIAANATRDYWKKRKAQRRDSGKTVSFDEQIDTVLGSASGSLGDIDKRLMIEKIDSLFDGDEQARSIFWLYYRQGLTAKEIASIPAFNLTTKGIESLIHRHTKAIREKIAPAEREKP